MWRDEAYFLDILIAARKVKRYLSGVTEEEFAQNELLQDATVRQLEIIGEAARRVSEEARKAHPEVPWHELIGMRNRLIHEYFRVDVPKVWDTALNDIPVLIALMEPLVPPEGEVQ